jgi:hypothetical protein
MSDEQNNHTVTNKAKWAAKEKAAWLAEQRIQRSYIDDVVIRLGALKAEFETEQYGVLSYAPEKYPLYIVKTPVWDNSKKTVLITGGVHGYETSGVHGAIRFLENKALNYAEQFNIMVAPCVSPWGYETINRWNPNTVDPNRSFVKDSSAEESAALMKMVELITADSDFELLAHIDLHETTDTDNSVFRPALAARDATPQDNWNIPDGFYLVGDSDNPVDDFQTAIIESVKKVTHIAPPDENGLIIGEPITQQGVINYATTRLGLCTGFSMSRYATTTEVYPDSPKVTGEDCIEAQVAAIVGGLDYLIRHSLY